MFIYLNLATLVVPPLCVCIEHVSMAMGVFVSVAAMSASLHWAIEDVVCCIVISRVRILGASLLFAACPYEFMLMPLIGSVAHLAMTFWHVTMLYLKVHSLLHLAM